MDVQKDLTAVCCLLRLTPPISTHPKTVFNAVVPIQGLNQMSTSSTSGVLKCEVRSHLVRNFSLKAEMVVVPQICGDVPTMAVSQDQLRQFRHLRNLELADPEFGTPQQVDVLLGADVYGQIVTSGFKKGGLEEPSALCHGEVYRNPRFCLLESGE